MQISLKRIVEQQGMEQFYDLGKDFSNFRRTIDGADEQIKQRFEQAISSKLNGKRVRARASRGYKQYVKDYEFDIVKISIDDYYDNYVVVAHDNTTPKPKEYFLKPGFKIQIIGPATGQPSPQKGNKPTEEKPSKEQPQSKPTQNNQQMVQAPVGNTPSDQPVKEVQMGHHTAYSVDQIMQDIKPWVPRILRKPDTSLRDFVTGLGWWKDSGKGKSVAVFGLKLPTNALSVNISPSLIQRLLKTADNMNPTISTQYKLIDAKENDAKDEWNITIDKIMIDKSI